MSLTILGMSLANLGNLFRPSLLSECLALVNACQTMADCDRVSNDFRAIGSVYSALAPSDRAVVKLAGQTRRMVITMNSIPGPVAPVAPVQIARTVDASTLTGALTNVANEGAANVAARAARTRRGGSQTRSQSADAIATATAMARIAGATQAGYNGRVVDPTLASGVGTIVAFGKVRTVIDSISGKSRQSLIEWASVESVRVTLGLPEKAFGRAPGLVGLLGKATQILNHGGFVARNAPTAGKYASAWKIGFFDNDLASDSLGAKEALITLSHDGVIECDAPDHEGARMVLADFNRRVRDTLIASDDLQTRVMACLVNHYGARDTDLGIYVQPFNAARALDLVVALRPIMGRGIYAWSHMDTESIGSALTESFTADLARLEKDCEAKSGDLKRIAGASLIERIERMRSECNGLATLLGADTVSAFLARIAACDALVVTALDNTSQRAMMLELT